MKRGQVALCAVSLAWSAMAFGDNPIIKDMFTADPAPLVYKDTVYLFTGHDEAKGKEMFTMKDWRCFTSTDMKTWTAQGSIMKVTDFAWATQDAWAAQMIERNGKFYFYAAVQHDKTHPGKAIGVAVADSPLGPFKDARGSALVSDDMTPTPNPWDDIDPTVFIDDDGTAWLAWGNPNCFLAKLKPNMTELDGPIQRLHVPNYTEGPWIHKRGNLYYLTYAAFAHQGLSEKICYATATQVTGPWTYQGILTGAAKNSYTIHPGIVEFRGQSYFFYHNAALTLPDGQTGGLGRRAVCAEYLYYNPDGTIQPIAQTVEGISVPPKDAPGNVPAEDAQSHRLGTFRQTDPGVTITQNVQADPEQLPGEPVARTAANPYREAPQGNSFNGPRAASSIGQAFTVPSDTRLARIVLFAGDGFGSASESPLTIGLYDLGPAGSPVATYEGAKNLFGEGKGLRVGYDPQAPGLLQFDFSGQASVPLAAGHTYVFELQAAKGSIPLLWRRTKEDKFAAGNAYRDRSVAGDASRPFDMVMAVYGAGAK